MTEPLEDGKTVMFGRTRMSSVLLVAIDNNVQTIAPAIGGVPQSANKARIITNSA
jgi:hypothetical protein